MVIVFQGLKALYSPHTGIVDYGEVTKSYANNFTSRGGTIHLGAKVIDFKENTENPEYPIRIVVSKSVSICGKFYLSMKLHYAILVMHDDDAIGPK